MRHKLEDSQICMTASISFFSKGLPYIAFPLLSGQAVLLPQLQLADVCSDKF